jgi:hypothetical protein
VLPDRDVEVSVSVVVALVQVELEMGIRASVFWGSLILLACACSGADENGGDRENAAGNTGSAGAAIADGGEPMATAGAGASGAGASGAGASGASTSGSHAGGDAGTSGGVAAGALRVDVSYGGACGSEAERCVVRTFDEDGTWIGGFEDADCDGLPDGQCATLVSFEGGSRSEHDMNCDGQPERCSMELVVTNGGMRPAPGEACAGVADCTTYLKDASGADLGYEIDDDCDGELDSCLHFTEEPRGTRRGGHDIGCDGTLDASCTSITLDASSGFVREELDSDCNQEPELVRCYLNDENGAETRAGDDSDCDGVLDSYCHTFTYDDGGRLIGLGNDDDCDGTFDGACTTITYDEYDNSRAETDLGCDGATCAVSLGFVHATGLGSMVDTGCNGELDSNCEIWSLDEEGRPLRADYDHDCDGIPSVPPDFTGSCWTSFAYTPL